MKNTDYVRDLSDHELVELIKEINDAVPFVSNRLLDLRKAAISERNKRKEGAERELWKMRLDVQTGENRVRLLSDMPLKQLGGIDGKVTE